MNREQLQSYGTIAALVISVIALFVTLYEASLMKTQSKAMVWPYFTISENYGPNGFSFIAKNDGTGPAIVQSVEVKYRDDYVRDFNQLLNQIKPNRTIGYDVIRMSHINNEVFKAGEEVVVFNMPWNDETRQMHKEMQFVTIKVQYASILGDKWLFDSEKTEHEMVSFKAEVEFNQ